MEIWKSINNYENLYEVSNLGRVRSLNKLKSRILKPRIRDGYYAVSLSKNNKRKDGKISRLVAIAFIENPLNLVIVNHLDGNKLNNNADNLEWCNNRENIHHYHSKKNTQTNESCIYKRKYGYVVSINFNNKRHYLGFYNKIDDAICIRDKYLIENKIKNKYI
jgi:hypothetical protein